MRLTMRIEDEYREVAHRRPWWFSPGLVGVALGGLLGAALLPTLLPPCSPPGANSEIVVRRFLERLGSSAAAIEECWTSESGPEELRAYLDATPPASISLVPYPGPHVFLLGPNAPAYAHWLVKANWNGRPPAGWPNDEAISIHVLRPDGSGRWTISAAGSRDVGGRELE